MSISRKGNCHDNIAMKSFFVLKDGGILSQEYKGISTLKIIEIVKEYSDY